ncbi:hypothetical protein M407DRAFT_20217 [Tulasnella calospora MUT 4182]|uniref:Transmembrane protein n=1 Tax=Tulasnella calospora MUT 4182 TaxID=1051891 RepID=A0A0C3MAH9_9AGAM|nr:hypothetical protein M407DRAFT_20217 [Tulasnella calospora MUT 4182]
MSVRTVWIFATLLTILFSRGAYGLGTVKAQCDSSMAWMSNSMGQSPCMVYAYLSSVCSPDKYWGVDPAQPPLGNFTYAPPHGTTANVCQCNTVAYNLMEACSFCQGAQIGDWKSWTTNCLPSDISKEYSPDVPSETVIPSWALLDPTQAGSWDATEARKHADSSTRKLNLPLIIGASVGGGVGAIILLVVLYLCCRSPRPGDFETVDGPAAAPPSFVASTLVAASALSVDTSTVSKNPNPSMRDSIPIPAAAPPQPLSGGEVLRPLSPSSSRYSSDTTASELSEIRNPTRYSQENLPKS